MNVVGVDPGNTGALATYNADTKQVVDVIDMPVFHMTINNKKRVRVDAVGLYSHLEMQKMLGAELVVIEAIGGRPKQGASSAYVLGHGVGMIYMACIALRLPIETVSPQTWKKMLRVPGKKDAAGKKQAEYDGMIMNRADELLPDVRHLFRGPNGGKRVDRAEASMLAKYGGDYLLRQPERPFLAVETDLVYRNADTGA